MTCYPDENDLAANYRLWPDNASTAFLRPFSTRCWPSFSSSVSSYVVGEWWWNSLAPQASHLGVSSVSFLTSGLYSLPHFSHLSTCFMADLLLPYPLLLSAKLSNRFNKQRAK